MNQQTMKGLLMITKYLNEKLIIFFKIKKSLIKIEIQLARV
jgi:hypothetical protein